MLSDALVEGVQAHAVDHRAIQQLPVRKVVTRREAHVQLQLCQGGARPDAVTFWKSFRLSMHEVCDMLTSREPMRSSKEVDIIPPPACTEPPKGLAATLRSCRSILLIRLLIDRGSVLRIRKIGWSCCVVLDQPAYFVGKVMACVVARDSVDPVGTSTATWMLGGGASPGLVPAASV